MWPALPWWIVRDVVDAVVLDARCLVFSRAYARLLGSALLEAILAVWG